MGASYEAAHARLALECLAVSYRRLSLVADGQLAPLPEPSQHAADRSYFETTVRLCDGLETVIQSYRDANDRHKKQVYELWSRESR